MAAALDLNADLGEGFGRWSLGPDHDLLEVITSANVACGFHAGDPLILRRVCARAGQLGVSVGAQVSYRDLAGFGRRSMDVPHDELAAEILYQLSALDGIGRVEGAPIRYVKPHGALYNRCFADAEQADAVCSAIAAFDEGLVVLGQPDSALLAAAGEHGLEIVHEAFADRAYADDGSLVPRGTPGAVIGDLDTVIRRVVRLATEGCVESIDGNLVRIEADSICLHSDTPGALDLAHAIRQALTEAAVDVSSFADADRRS